MNFADYMPLEVFKELLLISNKKSDDTLPSSDYESAVFMFFNLPLKGFLKDYQKQVGLSKIENSAGHLTNFSNAWNRLADNKEGVEWDRIFAGFGEISFKITYMKEDPPFSDEAIKKRYDQVINYFNNGNFNHRDMGSDHYKCVDCGQQMKLTFSNFKPKFAVFEKMPDGNLNYHSLVPPKTCLDDNVVELKVNFPTGELLIADWFRIDEFSKTVEYEGPDKWSNERSINHAQGRIISTTEYAEKFNFISVSVGNSSPRIFQNNDSIIIGCVQYDEDGEDLVENSDEIRGFINQGRVCTDYWGATIIDKQQLIDIVAIKAGDKATQIVEDYIKESVDNIIQVSPGEYNFKFHGNYWDFDNQVKDEELPNEIEKFFTVSKSELSLENKKKYKL